MVVVLEVGNVGIFLVEQNTADANIVNFVGILKAIALEAVIDFDASAVGANILRLLGFASVLRVDRHHKQRQKQQGEGKETHPS